MTLREWTDQLELPSVDEPQARLPLTGATAVHVTLRRFGRIVGSASVHQSQSERDLLGRRALGRALAQALGDPAIAALPEDIQQSVGRGLTLELEVAGVFQPMLGRTWQRVSREVEPGLDGVAMRQGDQWATLFASQMLAANLAGNVASRMPAMAAELALPAAELQTLIQRHNVGVYRFRSLHLAQSQPTSMPFETIRGDQLVADAQVNTRGIASAADELAAHLLGKIRETSADEDDSPQIVLGLLGDYYPVADAYRPLTAPPLDQALVSFALSRYAMSPHVDVRQAAQARDQAGRLLRDLDALHQEDASVLADAAVASAIAYAAAAYSQHSVADEPITRISQAAAQAVAAATPGNVRDVHALAMVAGASALLLADAADSAIQPQAARELLDAAWDAVPEHQHVAMLPWIGWGELDYAAATGQRLTRVEELQQVRTMLDASRVTSADMAMAPDLYGGFALAEGVATRPTAQSSRPAVFLATMLREPALTPPDRMSAALGRHLQTVRFLMQLSVREESLWSMRNGERAHGGIRAATWDSDMPNAAQAMTLLTLAETLAVLGR